MIKLQTASEDFARAQSAADQLAAAIELRDTRILGPTALFKRKGLERFQLEIKTYDREAAVVAAREAVELVSGSKSGRDVKFSVDVDPQ
jgi:primosomal protein N'